MKSIVAPSLTERLQRWMQRVKGPEAQPIRLPQARIYVLPTPAGLALAITLFLTLLVSINYNLALGFAITFLLAGVAVIHILMAWRNLLGLAIEIRPGGEAFAGSNTYFRVCLSNTHRHERCAVSLRRADGSFVSLDTPALGTSEGDLAVMTLARGWLPIGRLCVETHYPLGWIRAWSYIEPDCRTLIYPQPIAKLSLLQGALQANDNRRQHQAGQEDFADLRNYQRQDSPRHIAWKTVARSHLWMTKKYEDAIAQTRLFDWHALPEQWTEEEKLSQLSAWICEARRDNVGTLLRLPAHEIGPAAGEAHHRACLIALATYHA